MSVIIKDAATAYKYLNGVFCIYKANKVPFTAIQETLKKRFADDLNQLETRPCRERIQIVGNVGVDNNFKIIKTLSLADHPLVVGERYGSKDIPLALFQNIGLYTSGLNLVGVGQDGCYTLRKIRTRNPIKEYQIKCRLGLATDNFCEQGKPLRHANIKYVAPHKINTLCQKLLSANSRYAIKSIGCSLNTQEAYDVLSKGPIKPAFRKSDPIIYDLKCIDFDAPYFTLKLNSVNENSVFIYNLINQLGIRIKSYACVSSLRLVRIGKFTIDDALSYKETDLENVLKNIASNYEKVTELIQNNEFKKYRNVKFNRKSTLIEREYQTESPLLTEI